MPSTKGDYDLPALKALLARVEAATGPLFWDDVAGLNGGFERGAAYSLVYALTEGGICALGHAVALHEAVLPGWTRQQGMAADGAWASIWGPHMLAHTLTVSHKSEPLAIIAATLKALIAKAEGAENGTI